MCTKQCLYFKQTSNKLVHKRFRFTRLKKISKTLYNYNVFVKASVHGDVGYCNYATGLFVMKLTEVISSVQDETTDETHVSVGASGLNTRPRSLPRNKLVYSTTQRVPTCWETPSYGLSVRHFLMRDTSSTSQFDSFATRLPN